MLKIVPATLTYAHGGVHLSSKAGLQLGMTASSEVSSLDTASNAFALQTKGRPMKDSGAACRLMINGSLDEFLREC